MEQNSEDSKSDQVSSKQENSDLKAEAANPQNSNNDELSDLLDSCLDDFAPKSAPPTKSNVPTAPVIPTASVTGDSSAATGASGFQNSSTWTDEFKQFHKMMENYMDDPGEIDDMKKWMESLTDDQGGNPLGEGLNPLGGGEEAFAETLRQLTEQAQNIPEASPEDLASLLHGLDLGDVGGTDQLSDVMPLMQNVMHKLMSKELLYPSIKEITEKYPDWLNEKKSSLTTQEYDNYNKQYTLMTKVCDEFEKDLDGSDAAKKEQFEKVLMLMQQIQNHGNPPKELVSDVGPGIPLDEQGNLQIPGLPQQCSIM